jgi:hypothetical protein
MARCSWSMDPSMSFIVRTFHGKVSELRAILLLRFCRCQMTQGLQRGIHIFVPSDRVASRHFMSCILITVIFKTKVFDTHHIVLRSCSVLENGRCRSTVGRHANK